MAYSLPGPCAKSLALGVLWALGAQRSESCSASAGSTGRSPHSTSEPFVALLEKGWLDASLAFTHQTRQLFA